MRIGTEKYNSKLLEIEHYKKHRQMLPFVGKHYGECKKLLIIGESHYLEGAGKEEKNKKIIEEWYCKSIDDLKINDEEVYNFTNTAQVVELYHNVYKGVHRMWGNIRKAICDTDFRPDGNEHILSFIAFMNFFQRPSQKNGESIDHDEKDRSIANETLAEVIKVLDPNCLFFVSKETWKNGYDKNENIFNQDCVGYSAHPTSRKHWWGKNCKNYINYESKEEMATNGKGSFISFIKCNKIFT